MTSVNDISAAEYLFHQGTNYKAYELMGPKKCAQGYTFRVWAPNAKRVSIVGDFNAWDENKTPMKRIWRLQVRLLPLKDLIYYHTNREGLGRRMKTASSILLNLKSL